MFGLTSVDDLSLAELHLDAEPHRCAPGCSAFVAHERPQLAKFAFVSSPDRPASPPKALRGVPCVIDLGEFSDFGAYLAQLKRRSKGGIVQQIKKGRTLGISSKIFARELYHRQCFEIAASKRFRSGPVLAAFFRASPPSDFANGITVEDIARYLQRPVADLYAELELPPPPPPACPHHWALDWGAFSREPVAGVTGAIFPERLVAHIFLKRIGDLVRTRGVMAHGAYFDRNVMKLLLHDVIEWLLKREDPLVQGVRYLHYGAIEQGNPGLAAWKRSFGFMPMQFAEGSQPAA